MLLFNRLFPNFQKALVDRLVEERDKVREKKYENKFKKLEIQHEREKVAIRREVDIEKESVIKIQNELLEEMDTYRDIEELFAFKINKIYQLLNALKTVVRLSEGFTVAISEVKNCLDVLTSPNESQARIDEIISEKNLSYVSRKARSVKSFKDN
jgi:DNA-binding XRE family transcriptional regulator